MNESLDNAVIHRLCRTRIRAGALAADAGGGARYRKTGGQGTVDFYLLGCLPSDLAVFEHDMIDGHLTAGTIDGMADFCSARHHDVVMFDLHKKHIGPQLFRLSQQLRLSGVRLVAIDNVAIQAEMQAD